MALNFSVTDNNGVVLTYWRCTDIAWSEMSQTVNLIFRGWVSQAAYQAGLGSPNSHPLFLSGAAYTTFTTTIEAGGGTRAECDSLLKSQPVVSGGDWFTSIDWSPATEVS